MNFLETFELETTESRLQSLLALLQKDYAEKNALRIYRNCGLYELDRPATFVRGIIGLMILHRTHISSSRYGVRAYLMRAYIATRTPPVVPAERVQERYILRCD